jgi:hypothetical protein
MPPFYVMYLCFDGRWKEAGDPGGYWTLAQAIAVLRSEKANATIQTQWMVVDGNEQPVYQK